MIELDLTYNRTTPPGGLITYSPVDEALAALVMHTALLPANQTADEYASTAATSLCAALNEILGLKDEHSYTPCRSYGGGAFRIYSVPGFPPQVLARYGEWDPPVEYNFGLLKLEPTLPHPPTAEGNIPEILYYYLDTPIARRTFSYEYSKDSNSLVVRESVGWARVDGSWLDHSLNPAGRLLEGACLKNHLERTRVRLATTEVEYERTQEEEDITTSFLRSATHERLKNEFFAYNLSRVRAGEFGPESAQIVATWLRSDEGEDVLAYLRLNMYEAAIQAIIAMKGLPATFAFKAYWVGKLQKEL